MSRGEPAHIVVVDDEPEIRETLQEYLGLQGYRVTTASGGADLRRIVEDEPIDLYLMWWVDVPDSGNGDDEGDDEGDDRRRRPGRGRGPRADIDPNQLIDVSITTGVIDQFIVGDFINIGITGPFSGNGRYLHGTCSDPRDTGRVDITIENNQ